MDTVEVSFSAYCMNCDWKETGSLSAIVGSKDHVKKTGHTVTLKGTVEPATQIQLAAG